MDGTATPLASRLGRGSHRVPADGTCVMEVASMMAGEPFSDHPSCVHPTLAKVARLVNDTVYDDDRQALVPLLPELMAGPATDPAAPLLIALSCVDTALDRASHWSLRRYRRRLQRQLVRLQERGLSPVGDVRSQLSVTGAIEVSVTLLQHKSRSSLVTLLANAASAHAAALPPVIEPVIEPAVQAAPRVHELEPALV